jgi:hypothetical protein
MDTLKLTYDEKKAAEAAFQGRPFNPMWSAAARVVYDGIVRAMGNRQPFAPSAEVAESHPVLVASH